MVLHYGSVAWLWMSVQYNVAKRDMIFRIDVLKMIIHSIVKSEFG